MNQDFINAYEINEYYKEIHDETERKEKLTNLMMDRARMRRTRQTIIEERFNKKLEEHQQLKSFVYMDRRLSQMNILNDNLRQSEIFQSERKRRKSIKYTEQFDPNDLKDQFKIKIMNDNLQLKNIKRSPIRLPIYFNKQSDKLLDSPADYVTISKHHESFFYQSILQSDKSKSPLQQHQKQPKSSSQPRLQKRASIQKISLAYDKYYNQYKQATDNLIKKVIIQSRRKLNSQEEEFNPLILKAQKYLTSQPCTPIKSLSPDKIQVRRSSIDSLRERIQTQVSEITTQCKNNSSTFRLNKPVLSKMKTSINQCHDKICNMIS